jgi:predicted SprT family Zn-dependent metalloprotease
MSGFEIVMEAMRIRDELVEEYPCYADALRRAWFLANRRLRTSAGQARYRDSRVSLNPYLYALEANRGEFRNTVIHELAHLVAGAGKGHGPKWKAVFRHMGGNGQRCHNLEGASAFRAAPRRTRKVKVECQGCGHVLEMGIVRARRMASGRRTYRHASCGGSLILDSRFLTTR